MNRRYTVYLTEQEMRLLAYLLWPFHSKNGEGIMRYTQQDIDILANLHVRFNSMTKIQ